MINLKCVAWYKPQIMIYMIYMINLQCVAWYKPQIYYRDSSTREIRQSYFLYDSARLFFAHTKT